MPDDAVVDATRPGVARATDDEIRAVIEFLASAERPVILAGGGILRARTSTELTRFAELLHVPIIAAWRRADVISNDHPLFLGMAGFGAARSVRERLDAADALLVLGSRLNEPTTYAYQVPRAGQRWAHVDLVPGAASGSSAPAFTVAADAKAFLKSANERLLGRAVLDAGLVATRQANNIADRAAFEASSVVDDIPWEGPGVHPGRTIATLRRVLPDDAILTTDAGNFASWAGRGFRFRRPGTFLGPTSGAMGYGLPAAIAAALVHRDRPVVALVGDGGLGDDHGRARDGRARRCARRRGRLRQRTLRDHPDVAGTSRHGGRCRERARAARFRGGRACVRRPRRPCRARRGLRTRVAGGDRRRPGHGHPGHARPGLADHRPAAGLTRPTFHLLPAATWESADEAAPYAAASLAHEGFIHCTDGAEALGATFDRYFLADHRPFVALTVDLDALDVPWRYDVPGSPYPHIYGAIRRAAIIDVSGVVRAPDGRFEHLVAG